MLQYAYAGVSAALERLWWSCIRPARGSRAVWALIGLLLALAACGPALALCPRSEADGIQVNVTPDIERPRHDTENPAYSLADLVEGLRALGLTVVQRERPVDHGFAIEGVHLLVEEAPVFVYEFAEDRAAQAAAASVSIDAYSLTIVRTEGEVIYEQHSDWVETPHIYLKGRVIVIVGDHLRVLDALESLLGASLPSSSETPGNRQ